jgi:hypothetical protein
MSSYVLHTLRELRLKGEQQAERVLAEAAAARRRADDEAERLGARLATAREARAAARDEGGAPQAQTAAETQVRLRYRARLDAAVRACAAAVVAHRTEVREPAARAEEAARAAHLRARQRREVVDKTVARRATAARRDQERRAEAATDDLAQKRRRRH